MPIDHRIGTKVIKSARREEASATRVDPYPYIGIVKNNLDPTRSGRLQVFIPDLGGDPADATNWRTVSYASPYQGYTSQLNQTQSGVSPANNFDVVSHTYGMWMVPPDIGVQVIVIFIAGDPMRGYWLACVNPNLSHWMIPAIGSSVNVDSSSLPQGTSPGSPLPVVEFNEYATKGNKSAGVDPNYYTFPKPLHEVQYKILQNQGLDRDQIRGVIGSSSQRESPSQVFGISTPGRPKNDPADDNTFLTNLQAGKLDTKYQYVATRKGGHTFVMDDGSVTGNDQLIRLRTAQGHQILMHDTEQTVYISHANGESWIELDKNGVISMFSSGGINLRTKGTFNLHADSGFNLNAKGAINIKSNTQLKFEAPTIEFLTLGKFKVTANEGTEFKTGLYRIQADAKISVKAGGILALEGASIVQNSGGTDAVDPVKVIPTRDLPDTEFSGGSWTSVPKKINSIVTAAPTHEPYNRGQTPATSTPVGAGIQPSPTFSSSVDQTKQPSVSTSGVSNPAGDKDLRNQPPCTCQIGNLTSDEMTAYYAQLGKSESGGVYTKENQFGYIGKYQFGAEALQQLKYIKEGLVTSYSKLGASGHKALLANPNSWTGKNGIDSKEAWLSNGSEQENAVCEFTKTNYTAMVSNGAITKDLDNKSVAGMLSVGHLLGAGGANSWRKGSGKTDANGTSGDVYFQRGSYAVSVLAPRLPAVNAG